MDYLPGFFEDELTPHQARASEVRMGRPQVSFTFIRFIFPYTSFARRGFPCKLGEMSTVTESNEGREGRVVMPVLVRELGHGRKLTVFNHGDVAAVRLNLCIHATR